MKENESPESLPGCVGYFEAPLPPNECSKCKITSLCKKLTLAKKALGDILDAVVEMRQILRGENA